MTAPLHRIAFDRTHQRYKNAAGKVLPGVTTVLKLAQSAEPLIKWAFDMGRSGKEFSRVRDDAADVGKIAHGMIEAALRGQAVDPSNISPDMWTQAASALTRWQSWWEKEQLTVVESEFQMVSEVMQVGGTADVIAKTPDGDLWLADAKTSPRLYPEADIQAAVYSAMYEEVSGEHIARVYLVRVGKSAEDVLEVREVAGRELKVQAFAALAEARRRLQAAGLKV